MKKKIFILIVIFIIQGFYLQHFILCKSFQSQFYLVPTQVNLKLVGDIHDDRSGSILAARLIHNKLTVYGSAIFDNYVYFFSLPFLVNSISFVGMVGVGIGFYYTARRKSRKILQPICLAVLCVPLVELFMIPKIPVAASIILFWLVFQFFSLAAWFVFLPSKFVNTQYLLCIILIVISILWYFTFSDAMGFYCTLPAHIH